MTAPAGTAPEASGDDELAAAVAALDAGTPYKAALEELLLELPLPRAEELMQLLKEGRGAWLALLGAGGGSALFLGDALSGTPVALARAGFRVVIAESSATRARLALHRDRALAGGRAHAVLAPPDAPLPFADRAFDLVACEEEPPASADELERRLTERRRVCAGELVVTADNRLGYKRSSGRRGELRVPGPLEYASGVLRPGSRRTLRGYRRLVEVAGFAPPRAFALYPHRRDFSQIAALGGGRPSLFVGPQERRNRLKMLGYGAGLFPWLAPSFALVGARAELAARLRSTRAERWLAALAERLGEPRPVLEQLVATRGNTAVLHTAVPGAGDADPAGRWTVHVPLSPHQERQARRHVAATAELRRRFPGLPVPEPLFEGELEGAFLTCERRLPGFSAAQLRGDHAALARTYTDLAERLAALVLAPAAPADEAVLDELVGAKLELVLRFVHDPEPRSKLAELAAEARAHLLGRPLPRVYYHSDLRAKHVQVRADGGLLGLLDWGSSTPSDLPYFDLLNLIAHDRKQETGSSIGAAWRLVRGGGLRDFERRALDEYAERVGIDSETQRAIETLLPVLVGAMAEGNWDYSRPRWVQRGFGL